jgi:hypothetical protein
MSTVVCSGVQFNVIPQDGVNGIVPNGITYSWNVPNYTLSVTGGQSDTGQLSIFGTLTNNTNVVQTATYLVTPTPLNCGPNSNFTLTVTILPAAYINPITVPVCNGVVFGFTPTDGSVYGIVPAGTLYSWNTPSITASLTGGASDADRSGFFGQLFNSSNATQTATYTVTTKTGTCIGQPFTVQVVVNPPMIITPMSTVVCSRSMFTALPANGTNGTVPDNTLYSWSEPSFNPFLTGGQSVTNAKPITGTLFNSSNITQTTVYTITPTSGVCTGANFTLTVIVNPTPEFVTLTTVTCSGVEFQVSPAVGFGGGNIVPAGTRYRWSEPTYTGTVTGGQSNLTLPGRTYIAGTLSNRTNVQQTVTYQVFPRTSFSGNCVGAAFSVVGTLNPTPEFVTLTTVTCSGVEFQVSPAAGVYGGNIVPTNTLYKWDAPTYTGTVTGGQSSQNLFENFVSGTLSNRTNAQQIATYTVTPPSIACGGCWWWKHSSVEYIVYMDRADLYWNSNRRSKQPGHRAYKHLWYVEQPYQWTADSNLSSYS